MALGDADHAIGTLIIVDLPLPFYLLILIVHEKILILDDQRIKIINIADMQQMDVDILCVYKIALISTNTHRIHGAGIYANIKGVYWWDPWHTINIAAPWIRHGI